MKKERKIISIALSTLMLFSIMCSNVNLVYANNETSVQVSETRAVTDSGTCGENAT